MRCRIYLGVSSCCLCFIVFVSISGCSSSVPELYLAAEGNNVDDVRRLLQDGKDVDKGVYGTYTPLCIAASKGHKEVVTMLLDAGADVNANNSIGWTPLTEAVRNNHAEIASFLLEHGADPNPNIPVTSGDPLLVTAIKARNHDLAIKLIARGADVNRMAKNRESAPLLEAIRSRDATLVKLLLDKGADIHATTPDGTTSLHLAAMGPDLQTVKYCVESGIDVNVRNNDYETPLHMAALAGNMEVINFLLDKGAMIDVVNSSGMSLLHVAALGGDVQTVKFLLNKGLQMNSKDANGFTVLLMAAQGDNEETVHLLIQNGAEVVSEHDTRFPEPAARACEMTAEHYAASGKRKETAESFATASHWYNEAALQCKQLADEFHDKYKKKVMAEVFWSSLAAAVANTAIAYAEDAADYESRRSAERYAELFALKYAAKNRTNIEGYYAALSSQRVITMRQHTTLNYDFAPSQQAEALGEMLRGYKTKQSLYERKSKECAQKMDCYEKCASEQALAECLALIDGASDSAK